MAAALQQAAATREGALPAGERSVRTTLEWIGFPHAIVRERITRKSFTTFGDVQLLEEADITALANAFTKRTPANTRIQFGQRRIKRLKALIHWSKDFRRCSLSVSINGLNATTFIDQLEKSLCGHEI